jgi:hypothetical protein
MRSLTIRVTIKTMGTLPPTNYSSENILQLNTESCPRDLKYEHSNSERVLA